MALQSLKLKGVFNLHNFAWQFSDMVFFTSLRPNKKVFPIELRIHTSCFPLENIVIMLLHFFLSFGLSSHNWLIKPVNYQ